jgi:PhnB protein
MQAIGTYFNFMGNSEEAMNFYKSVFGGEIVSLTRFKDTPGSEHMPAHERDKIMNIMLVLKNGDTLMATDFLESMEQKLVRGNNVHLVVNTDAEEEVDRYFKALSAGGKVEMPVNKTFWGAYFGMCEDRFGIRWMLSYTYPQNK